MSSSAPRSIAQYLEQLREALQDDDPALLQDALYDAEEYLRAEVAQHADKPEADVLELIASTYGAPSEVAEAYRATEAKVKAAIATPPPAARRTALGRFFGVLSDSRAYTSLLYLLLSLATGIFYFTWTVTGLSLSFGFLVLIIGIPFFLLFLGSERALALAEGRLVETLLNVRMPRRPAYPRDGAGLLRRIGFMLKDWRTWSAMFYLLLMLPLGCVYFTLAVSGTAVSLSLILSPFIELARRLGWVSIDADVHFGVYPGYEMPTVALPLVVLLGIVLLTLFMHLVKGLGSLHGQLAKSLLVASSTARQA